MFCPRCSQQLVNDVRFCSRCGIPLHVISEVVANNGFAPSDPAASKSKTPRQKGMRIGGKVMFFALALLPLFFGLCFVADNPDPLLVPAAIFFVGLCWMIYSRIFAEDIVYPSFKNQQPQFRQPQSFALLPDRMPVRGLDSRRVDTADIPQSPGVTDHTTQFFDEAGNSERVAE